MKASISKNLIAGSIEANKEKTYWLNKLSGELPKTYFPYDFLKRDTSRHETAKVTYKLTSDLGLQLTRLTNQSDQNLFAVLLTVLNILLRKYTGNKDIKIIIPIYKQALEGEYINSVLLIRNRSFDKMTVKELLLQVKASVSEANQNADYPIEDLLYHLNIPVGNSNGFPLSDIAILLENIHKLDYIEYTQPNILFAFHRNNGSIEGYLEFNPRLYKKNTIDKMISHFTDLLTGFVKNLGLPLAEIEVLSEPERKRLLQEFNGTASTYPRDKAIIHLFERQVDKTPARTALVYPHQSSREPVSLTYQALNERANQLGRSLKQRGVRPNTITALRVEPSLEMITAIAAILKAGGAYLPLAPDYPAGRISYMLKDSKPILGLTDHPATAHLLELAGEIIDIKDPRIYKGEKSNINLALSPEDLLYTIYTSGTTGKPKGVLIQNGNLVNYICWVSREIGINAEDKTILTSSYAFDLGYTLIYSAILTGAELHMAPGEVYYYPEVLLDYVQRQRISYIKVTPSLFSILIKSTSFSPGKCASLRIVLLGGEPINTADVEQAHLRCKHLGIMNHYGPTEVTVGSIAQSIDFTTFAEYKEITTIGKPIHNTQVYILDKHLQPVPPGVPAELCLAGDGLSRGYLNQPELTCWKFPANPYGPRKRLFRTGDLARWLDNGTVELLGRIDQQVKIRGYRIELGEIQKQLSEYEALQEAVVVDRKNQEGNKYLCAYLVLKPGAPVKVDQFFIHELREYLGQKLPDYMIPNNFVLLERIPLTPNGKLDRNALPEPQQKTAEHHTPPRNQTERKLAAIWGKLLEVEPDTVGLEANFFELGGHSLKAIMLISSIHKELNVKIQLIEIFRKPTIGDLAEYIEGSAKDYFASIQKAEVREFYGLSSAQKRLYILQQMDLEGIGYNTPRFAILNGQLDKEKMTEIFKGLIKRHESLRTSFEMLDGEPIQRIYPEVEFVLESYDLHPNKEKQTPPASAEGTAPPGQTSPDPEVEKILRGFIRPFDLTRAPLMRIGMVKTQQAQHILMMDLHHIISDGVSIGIYLSEFMALYEAEDLAPLLLQYKDYAQWQNSEKGKKTLVQQENFWLANFEDEIPVLDLLTDYPRPALQSFAGKRKDFEIDSRQTEALKELALKHKSTLYIVMLGIFKVFTAKVSGQEDIVVGLPTAGRRHSDLQKIIGMFVNTLALRSQPRNEQRFPHYLADLTAKTLEAFDNQDYQFEDLVEKVAVNREVSRNPLFDVLFVLQNIEMPSIKIPGLNLQPYGLENRVAKFDLSLIGVESGDRLFLTFEYSTKLFEEKTIQRFINYFQAVLTKVLQNPEQKISQIEILTREEKNALLYDLHDTQAEYPREKNLRQLFEEQVEKTPLAIAVTHAGRQLSYGAAREKINSLAGKIRGKGVKPGAIIAIMVEPSLDTIIGALAVLKAGCAYLPMDPGYPGARIRYMLEDSQTPVLLTQNHVFARFAHVSAKRDAGKNIPRHVILLDEPEDTLKEQPTPHPPPLNQPHPPAYIIYTSGTTGKPKGTLIEHRNIVRLMINEKKIFAFSARDIWTMFHSFCFDFSVWEMYGALLYGGRLIVIPKAVVLDPGKFLELLKRECVTVLNQTPAAFYNLALEELKQGKKELSLEYVIFGGDALKPAALKPWKTRYPGTKLVNMYGITETTVHVTYKEITPREIELNRSFIGIPLPTLHTYVTDNNREPVPLGGKGELCVGGEGVGRGYLNNPELTREKFIPDPYRPGERLYKSGDLVKLSEDGEMEYLGRIDTQVKLRGFRIETGEIENRLLTHEGIKEALVLAREDARGDKFLCAYFVSREELEVPDLKEYLSKQLPDYMVPAFFVHLAGMPLTPNGKIDRKALPEPDTASRGSKGYTAPRDAVESTLAAIWSEVLGIEKGKIGIDADFFQLGGHSLKAILLTAKVHKELNVKLPLAEIFQIPTLRGLAEYIKEARTEQFVSITPLEEKEYYPMSSTQRRLFVLQQMEPGGIAYNVPQKIPLRETLDKERVESTFRKLIKRHDSLRTSFRMVGVQTVQQIHPEVEFVLRHHELLAETGETEEITRDFIKPFDLGQPPLMRVLSITAPGPKNLLLIDFHHIITDGISQNIITREFIALYNNQDLPPLRLRYQDFSGWQQRRKQEKQFKLQEEFWKKSFRDNIPVLQLPTDYLRPPVQRFEGDEILFLLDERETAILARMVKETDTTLFMVLLALFNILLAKLSGQEDIIVGTPIAARRHADLENIIGMFVNTLPLRNFPAGDKGVGELLQQLKTRTLEAFENQEYQFEDLVDLLPVQRDTARNPLFDVMFNLQNQVELPQNRDFATNEENRVLNRVSRFDITLAMVEAHNQVRCSFIYNTRLFKAPSVQRIIGYFKQLLQSLRRDLDRKIRQIEIIPGEERQQILYEFNNTTVDWPKDKKIQQLFAEQVKRTPDQIAVTLAGSSPPLTYRELDAKSNQLARFLKKRGIGPNTITGIMLERSAAMMVGILGILKTGGAYLPLDPEYPEARISYIMKDSAAAIVLTDPHSERLTGDTHRGMAMDPGQWSGEETRDLEPVGKSTDLAYVIYTSGSTGRPKGVMIENKALVNFIKGISDVIAFAESDRILSLTTISFDIFILETILPLTKGSTVVIGTGEEQLGTGAAALALEAEKITILQVTPSRLALLIEDPQAAHCIRALKYLLVGGEAFPQQLLEKTRELREDKIYNLFGPTETTVWSSLKEVSRGQALNIGRPIANTEIFILGKHHTLQPLGIAGELCIAGAGLARGYANNPELTEKKFTAHPFAGGRRLYHTGDIARWLPDGNIEIFGRRDLQVKIRGFRIELGEIEKQLAQHERIKEAVVIAKENQNNDKNLCAYFVVPPGKEEDPPDSATLREFLAHKLPLYMIPAHFVSLPHMPLTPNGKVDRTALPNLEEMHPATRPAYAAPQTETEKMVAQLWKEILNLEEVGIHENFFDLGGNSVNLIQLNSRLQELLKRDIPVVSMFRHLTIHSFVLYLNQAENSADIFRKKMDRSAEKAKGKNRLEKRRNKRESE